MSSDLKTFTIASIRFYNQETGFMVGVTADRQIVRINETLVPVLGKVTLRGAWVNDPKWGVQFVAEKVYYESAEHVVGILLSSGYLTGIQREKAKEIIKTLGTKIFDVLDGCLAQRKDPLHTIEWRGERLPPLFVLRMVRGIGPIVAEQVLDSWDKQRGWIQTAITSVQAGLSTKQYRAAASVMAHAELRECILHTPYRLSVVPGFTWQTVDEIASLKWEGKTEIEHDSPLRLCAALREVVRKHHVLGGHMYMDLAVAIQQARELSQPKVHLWTVVKDLIGREGLVVTDDKITLRTLDVMEQNTAAKLLELSKARRKFDIEGGIDVQKYSHLQLAPEQREAVRMALHNSVSVITGGPGTGKTAAVLATFLKVLDDRAVTYLLCAPTGKAAVRMSEATGVRAHTLHKAFRLYAAKPDKLQEDVLVIDEASMISAELLSQVLDCVQGGQSIVFIGDADQLPPVGAGEPLMQMIESDAIPCMRLSHIYRQGAHSGIVVAAHDINNGLMPTAAPDFVIHNVRSSEVFRTIEECFDALQLQGIALGDTQVLTPVNKRPVGRISLNERMSQKFNPHGTLCVPTNLTLGSRVINLKNNYRVDVMNGEVGYVTGGRFDDFAPTALPMSLEHAGDTVIEVLFEGHDFPTELNATEAQDVQMAWAITIHKSQGSQFRAVIVVIPPTIDSFSLRQLPYTGVTRASEVVHLLNVDGALQKYVSNEQRVRRASRLAHYLDEEVNDVA